MDKHNLEEKLKTYIKRSHWSQAAVADLLEVRADTFNKWLKGVNQFPGQELLKFCELMNLDEAQRAELFDLAGHVLAKSGPGQRITFVELVQEFRLRREFIPLEQLNLSAAGMALVDKVNFVGIKWSDAFGFTVGLVRADALSEAQINEISQNFIKFNDRLYRRREELRLPFLSWLVAFTLGGVLCFVFERGGGEDKIDFIGEKKKGSSSYDQGVASLGVQTSATTFSWTVDLTVRRVYKHLGKQPHRLNYHNRQMEKEMARLEEVMGGIIK